MKLETLSWEEVGSYLDTSKGIFLPTGSIEQHGPLGLIGTDAICAREICWAAAEDCNAIVAPELAYAPAPFNMSFPGTVSISEGLFRQLAHEVLSAFSHHGFQKIYVLNGHGANLAPLRQAAKDIGCDVRIRSWWDFDQVNVLRQKWYGDWEGMHATPAEIAITQHTHRILVNPNLAAPQKLTPAYIQAHAGDKHGPADEHRRDFPDGRVGSHSGLATPNHGKVLLKSAAKAVAADYQAFLTT
jgi:creatinine amidohydrolase